MKLRLSPLSQPQRSRSSPPGERPRQNLQRKCACGGTPGPAGECENCRRKRLGLQRCSATMKIGQSLGQETGSQPFFARGLRIDESAAREAKRKRSPDRSCRTLASAPCGCSIPRQCAAASAPSRGHPSETARSDRADNAAGGGTDGAGICRDARDLRVCERGDGAGESDR